MSNNSRRLVRTRGVVLFCSALGCVLVAGLRGACAEEVPKYDSRGQRNPFIPLVTPDGRLIQLEKKESPQGALVVEGVIYDKYGRSFALVNGSVCAIGEHVGDYQVLRIESDKVVFIKDGETTEISLTKEEE